MGKHTKYNNIAGCKGRQFREVLRGLNLEEVLVVAIDAAKFLQKALVCNYFGDIIRELVKRGYPVTPINALTTHEERNSALNWCKTDDLDLVAIAYTLMQNKGTENVLPSGKYRQLLTLTRSRRKEVIKRANLRIEIRKQMDFIWREYQGYIIFENGKPKKQKIFNDFWGKSSLFFMENYPHPTDVIGLSPRKIRELSQKHSLRIRDEAINKLLYCAKQALPLSKEELEPELFLLDIKLKQLKKIDETITDMEKYIEKILLQTDGKLLLTVPGIGVVSAAEFYSELGDISNYDSADQLIKKAGTNPMVYQSGDKNGYYGRISKQGNRHLRFMVFTVGKLLSQHNLDLRSFYLRLKEKGKHSRKAYIAVGNKFIRVAFAMLKNKKPFESKVVSINYLNEISKKVKHQTLVA